MNCTSSLSFYFFKPVRSESTSNAITTNDSSENFACFAFDEVFNMILPAVHEQDHLAVMFENTVVILTLSYSNRGQYSLIFRENLIPGKSEFLFRFWN